jgi:hypothetical protein
MLPRLPPSYGVYFAFFDGLSGELGSENGQGSGKLEFVSGSEMKSFEVRVTAGSYLRKPAA